MSDQLKKLAQEIQKSRPEATIPVIVKLKTITEENIEKLSSKGLKIRRVIKSLSLVAGDINADPNATEAVRKMRIVKKVEIAGELEILG